jgi:RHS repeat-associated protein
MGYFHTAEPEIAAPGNSFASPKTHTPLLRVEERGLRFYSPEAGRWTSRDPIGENGGRNVYVCVENNAVAHTDSIGLIKVCCTNYGFIFRHCEYDEKCPSGWDSYDVWHDSSCERSMDNGTPCCCATKNDIEKCLMRHPYRVDPRGPHQRGHLWDWWENNCQTSLILGLGNCCLKSNWRPSFGYAGDPRGRCLRSIVVSTPNSVTIVCTQWELPDWRDSNPPPRDDPRVPNAEPIPRTSDTPTGGVGF